MPYADKEKARAQARKRWHAQKNDPVALEAQRQRQRKARQATKDEVLEWKKQGCLHCGNKEPVVLAAHHRDPDQKTNTINRLIANRAGKETIRRELAKCDCVCANCHLMVHAGLIR
jgi:hypothetical protein